MPRKKEETKRKVYVVLVPKGARGCGHLSLVLQREDGGYREYAQGAANPGDLACKLLLFKQVAVVSQKDRPRSEPITRLLSKNKRWLLLPRADPDRIEESIRRYIEKNAPYDSAGNNCSFFIVDALNRGGEGPRFRNFLIPNLTFFFMRAKLKKHLREIK